MPTKHSRSTYQVKISLMDSKPPIWRRLLVHSDISLSVLHTVIQCAMGWEDCHLHQFSKDGIIYCTDDEFGDPLAQNENTPSLSMLLKNKNDSILYEYDFGDGWVHKIVLEKTLPYDSSVQLARCIKGKRSCPPEDCGGVWGYASFLEQINDPSNPEHEAMLEWIGGEFDPEYFSVNDINSLLSSYVK